MRKVESREKKKKKKRELRKQRATVWEDRKERGRKRK